MRRETRATRALGGLAALLLLAGGLSAAPAEAYSAERGELGKRSQVLRHGCHNYAFRYSVNPPAGDWGLEVFVVHRATGRKVAHQVVMGGAEPETGRKAFRLCRPSTKPGRYKISGKLSVQNGFDYAEWWIKPAYFRFYRG